MMLMTLMTLMTLLPEALAQGAGGRGVLSLDAAVVQVDEPRRSWFIAVGLILTALALMVAKAFGS